MVEEEKNNSNLQWGNILNDMQNYFDLHCFDLNHEDILLMNNQGDIGISNVINGLAENCFGLEVYDPKEPREYSVFYIDNKKELSGIKLELSLELNSLTRKALTVQFSKEVHTSYPHTDPVDTFNTFQSQARSVFEKFGFFTFGNELNEITKGKSAVGFIPNSKGVLTFPTLRKIELYRWLFGENPNCVSIDGSDNKKVYLLIDSNNNLIKIGQSKNPTLREKTLQGESPKWDLITTWVAPISEETYLHKHFSHKRVRGEWFNLNFTDLKTIKEYMSKYKDMKL